MQTNKPLHPVLLGRPVHAFNALAARLSQHVTQQLQQTGHRSIALSVQEATFTPLPPCTPDTRSVNVARATVQAHMAARYGFTPDASDLADTLPPNATERRIASFLETTVAQAVDTLLPASSALLPTVCQRWQWQAQIAIGDLPAQPLSVTLSHADSCRLEAHITARRKPHHPLPAGLPPLPVSLHAVLLEKTLTAADIQGLQVGSVLPIALERARVALNGLPMLTASVAEHQGKLHLTAFETME